MFLEGSKIIVDYECERFLPGWKPRRFGEEDLNIVACGCNIVCHV